MFCHWHSFCVIVVCRRWDRDKNFLLSWMNSSCLLDAVGKEIPEGHIIYCWVHQSCCKCVRDNWITLAFACLSCTFYPSHLGWAMGLYFSHFACKCLGYTEGYRFWRLCHLMEYVSEEAILCFGKRRLWCDHSDFCLHEHKMISCAISVVSNGSQH